MGEHVEFPGEGGPSRGYLATPVDGGAGPALIVLGPLLGLEANITTVCDRFATEGFTALAPEVFGGAGGAADEPGQGGAVVGITTPGAAEAAGVRERGAIAYLEEHPKVHGKGVGVVGFGFGGGVALATARSLPEDVKACVPFYGMLPGFEAVEDWEGFEAPVQGHFAGRDDTLTPDTVHAFEARLKDAHRQVEVFVYDAAPGFFDESRPEVYDADAAHDAWIRTLSFLRAHLG